jgi:amino acid adenylation domain-containing protein
MTMPPILDHFASAALAMATRVAIHHGERACTYAELHAASDRVAMRLCGLDIGPGDIVGIALERSIEWTTAMLGILKCGAAYLPLDPSYPAARLALCIADSGARRVISDAAHRHIGQDRTLLVESLISPDPETRYPVRSVDVPVDGGQPAYLLYTSGSTGRPKGVVVSRDAIAYQMNWFIGEFACTADDVILQKTPTAFDASVWEYLAPLMTGATMVIAANTPDAVTKAARRHRATMLQMVPAMLRAMADPASLRDLASLRLLFCGGEPLPRRLVTQVHNYLPIPIVNLYGPTEATVQCAFHICRPGDGDTRDPVPLGRPLPGTRFHIDAGDATDESGELVIEGPGVALRYHGLPEITASRFGMSDAGQPSYRSGDRVARDRHGDYLFLGRADNQVKLRGLRIELEEIDQALARSSPTVHGAMVIVNEALQIEAFVEVQRKDEWDEAAAREALAAALPGFMQPAVYTVLDRLPVLPNGKLDRGALRALSAMRAAGAQPDAISPASATAEDATGTGTPGHASACMMPAEGAGGEPPDGAGGGDIAARVRAAWCALLPRDAGDDSHFFRAGGHSLLAMQLIAALNRDLGLQLSASTLFARPTLGALTGMVEAAVRDARAQRLPAGFVKLGGPSGTPRVWFVHPAGGGIWCYRDIAVCIDAAESYGIACEPLDGTDTYETDLRRMARRYADMILEQQPDSPLILCGYSFGGNVAYEMALHLQARQADVALLVLLDTFISRATGEDTLDFIVSYARKLVNGGDDAPSKAMLGAMPVGQRNRMLLELGIRGGHLPADALPQDVEQGLAMWIANNQAASTHVPRGAYDGPSLFIRCTGNARDSLEGWRPLLKRLHVEDVPADHFTVYRQPVAGHVAALMGQQIERSARRSARALA